MPTTTIDAASLAGTSHKYKRPKNDFYATQPKSVRSLLSKETFSGNILEPCCGQGHISETLKNYGFQVYSNDLINRGYGETHKNFLEEKFPKYDNIITNPPFRYAKEFIEKSLQLAHKKVAIFAKIQLLEGVNRYKFYQKHPPKHIYVFVNRQTPLRNGLPYNPTTGKSWSSTMCFAWYVWEKDFKGLPTVDWVINKQDKKKSAI